MGPPMTPHDVQAALDAEDAGLRLRRLLAALAAEDDAKAEVVRLERELRQARRRAKAASWDVATVRGGEERRRPKPKEAK